MAHVAARGRKSLRQLGRFDGARPFKEDGGEHQTFKKCQLIGSKRGGAQSIEAARGSAHRKHGALSKKGIDSHD